MNFDFKYSLHCRLYNSDFKQLFTSIFHGKYFQAIFDRERRAEELVGEVLLVFNDIMIVRIIAGSLFFKWIYNLSKYKVFISDMNYKQCLLKAVVPAEYNQEEQNYMKGFLESRQHVFTTP